MSPEKEDSKGLLSHRGIDNNNELVAFLFNKIPLGIIILNESAGIIYRNKKASHFLNRFELPGEVATVSKRIFDAMQSSRVWDLFPGEIYIKKQFGKSLSSWTFRMFFKEKPIPYVCVFIIEDTISNKLDLNQIRQQFRLTRRETDILRRVLDGMKNLEIAEDLEIAEQTVKDHLSNVYMKTGVENRFALIRQLINPSEQ